MWIARTAAPASPPVTLDEAKRHVRYSGTDRDDLLTSLVEAATEHLEGRNGILSRALVTQQWEYRIDGFPCRSRGRIELPYPPLQSVQSVKYIDTGGVERTLTEGVDYTVDAAHLVGRVRPAYGTTWPATLDDEGVVRIAFTAGYGTPGAVPRPLKQAILLLVGHWWMNPEAATVGQVSTEHALAVEALTQPYRMAL